MSAVARRARLSYDSVRRHGRADMTYRLYRLDGRRQIVVGAPDCFEAQDDDLALAEAQRRRDGGQMALWTGGRFVGLVGAVGPAVAQARG